MSPEHFADVLPLRPCPSSGSGAGFAADGNVIPSMIRDLPAEARALELIEHIEAQGLIEQLGFDVYLRRRWDASTGTLVLVRSHGLTSEAAARMERVSMDDSLLRGANVGGASTLATHVGTATAGAAGPERDQLQALDVRAMHCLPLLEDGALAGTITLGSKKGETFSELQRLWLQTLTAMLTPARAQQDEAGDSQRCPGEEIATTLNTMRRLAGNLERRVNQRSEALANYHSRLRHLVSELVLTEQRERRRIAGELHDHLAQLLVACKMKLALVRSSISSQAPPDHLWAAPHDPAKLVNEIDGFLDESLTYTRNLVAQISPVLLYEQGLLAALRWLAEAVMPRQGLLVTLDEQTDLAGVHLDEDVRILLFESVRELLVNVLEHAGTNAATVTVRQDEREGELEVLVSDAGVGFDPAQTQMTGGPSQQGFGLFSIRERMSLLGGRFELSASPGGGTCASLRVALEPVSVACEPVECDQPSQTPCPPVPMRRRSEREHIHVLVVDDHVVVREGLMMMLGKEQDLVIVGEAADGPSALDLARRLRPHVVLMDVGLPGLDGIETTRRLTATHRGVKVVGLSMHEDDSTAAAMRGAGAVDYLCKGCSPELLIDTIRRAAQTEAHHKKPPAASS